MEDFVASRSSAVQPYNPDDQDRSENLGGKKHSKTQTQTKPKRETSEVDVEPGEEHKLDERA